MPDLFGDTAIEQTVHFVIATVEPHRLGATKLNKVLWHADVEVYRHCGRTLTGQSSYVRLPNGPAPNGINDVLDALKRAGKIEERSVTTKKGLRREFISLKPPGTGLSSHDVDALRRAIAIVCALSAARASSDTHDALWGEIRNGDQMPVRAAAVVSGTPTSDEIERVLFLTQSADE